ncbi:MAG: cell division ATP-binding protein FtsE [Rhodothermaceae bacterium]
MLNFTNVDFQYPNQPVFEQLNMSIDPGDFAFLIGKSGVGKSTLFQLIYMNYLPQAGTVEVGNYNSETIRPKDLPMLRRNLGIIFQDFKLLEDRTIYENLSFILEVTGHSRKQIRKKVMEVLTEVGLSHKAKNMPLELSGGEQQRIAIARAIINEPMLLLADEPTGNLDPETSDEILEIIKNINNRGTSVIFATHNYDLVKKFDTKIYKLTEKKAVRVTLKKKQAP